MLDGIDGSGKSTVMAAWKEYLTVQAETIFDLKAYWKEPGRHPEYSELEKYDYIFSAEPTYVGIGQVIRKELINHKQSYPPLAIAEAYSLDRLILYTKIIIPALQDGKTVLQDRGISTSLCYQPVSHPELTTDIISQLPGNALALTHRPDHLVLLSIDPDEALRRLEGRAEKRDNVIFEQRDFQKRAAERFASAEYRQLFTERGTQVHYLQAQEEAGIMKETIQTILNKLLNY